MSQPNKTRVQVATDPAFSNIVHDVEGAYTTALQIAEAVLPQGVNLYARGMHGHPTTGDSSWSTTVQFQIKLAWSDWDGSANGIEHSLNSTNSLYVSAVALSDTKVLVCYSNGSYNSYKYAIVLTISGSGISAGVPVLCHDTTGYFNSAVVLSDTKVLVSYSNDSHNSYLYAVILTIDGTNITASTPVQCNSTDSEYISAVVLSDTKVLITYRNQNHNNYLYTAILTIDGISISAGIPVQCNSSNNIYVSAAVLSDTKVLVSYRNDSHSGYLYAVVLTVNGTNITASTPVQCNSANSRHLSAVALSDTKVVVCYRNDSNGYHLYATVLIIDGTDITAVAPVSCNDTHIAYTSVVVLSDITVWVCYRNESHNNYLYAVVLTIRGDVITAGTPVQCNTSTTGGWSEYDISATKVGDSVFVSYNKGINTALYGKVLMDN